MTAIRIQYGALCVALAAALMGLSASPATAADPKPTRVLILPFTIHAAEGLAFLRDGVRDMLSTRLAREGEVLPELAEGDPPASTAAAAEAGRRAGADYLAYGSITIIGDQVSTDARFYDVAKGRDLVIFHDMGERPGDVIEHINAFATRINADVFGRTQTAAPVAEAPPETDTRRHPEALWAEEQGVSADRPAPSADTPRQDRSRREAAAPPPGDLWRSRNLPLEIVSLTVADVDGDGNQETVFITDQVVHVYRYINGRFARIGEVDTPTTTTLLTVDAADINGNGRAEIFVTAIARDADQLRSFVLEHDGNRFAEIADSPRWYYRVMEMPGEGRVLLGQKRGFSELFAGGVQILDWRSGEYRARKPLDLPRGVDIFEVAVGDVLNDGRRMVVIFTETDYIRILSPDGSEEWQSGETYGGSKTYLDVETGGAIGNYKETDRYFIPQRLHIVDTDGDGANELVAVRNKDSAKRLFSKVRMFKGGEVEVLRWDKVGVYPQWQSREINGYIADTAVADADNDGRRELVMAVVSKADGLIGKPRSFIIHQTFPSAAGPAD